MKAKIATHWTEEEAQAIWQDICQRADGMTDEQIARQVRENTESAKEWGSQKSVNQIYGRMANYAAEIAEIWKAQL